MSDLSSGNIAPALQAFSVPLSSLNLDPANVRRHPEKNLSRIKASLVAFGQQKPVVIDSRGIVLCGNGTIEAAKALGWTHVAVIKSNLAGAERVAYSIADNRTSELAEWDEEALGQVLQALRDDESVDHAATGFDDSEIDALIGISSEFQPAGPDEQPRLDQKDPIQCPHCGHKFIWDPWAK